MEFVVAIKVASMKVVFDKLCLPCLPAIECLRVAMIRRE